MLPLVLLTVSAFILSNCDKCICMAHTLSSDSFHCSYAPPSRYDDNVVEEFHAELQSLVNQTPKQTFLVVKSRIFWRYKEIGMLNLE